MRALTLLLASLLATTPVAYATLTDPLQDDAGTGRDAADAGDAPTKLVNRETGSSEGRYQGKAILLDDPVDVYGFQIRAAPGERAGASLAFSSGSPACAAPSPVALAGIRVALVDATGAVVAEAAGRDACAFSAHLEGQGMPGAWSIAVALTSPAPGEAGLAPTSERDEATFAADYALELACDPRC